MKSKNRKLLFISGIPGTGKTTIGNYLQNHFGYEHINLEDEQGSPGPLTNDSTTLNKRLQSLFQERRKPHAFSRLGMKPILITYQSGTRIPCLLRREFLLKDTVITWGFGPDIPLHIQAVNLILDSGAVMIWLDGNREAAERAFLKRGTVPKELFDKQMTRIQKVDIRTLYHPINYDPFTKEGVFKDTKQIVEELLEIVV